MHAHQASDAFTGPLVLLQETETHAVLATLQTTVEPVAQGVCSIYLERSVSGFLSEASACVSHAVFETYGITISLDSPNRIAAGIDDPGEPGAKRRTLERSLADEHATVSLRPLPEKEQAPAKTYSHPGFLSD